MIHFNYYCSLNVLFRPRREKEKNDKNVKNFKEQYILAQIKITQHWIVHNTTFNQPLQKKIDQTIKITQKILKFKTFINKFAITFNNLFYHCFKFSQNKN